MPISTDKVVTFHYHLSDAEGNLLEVSDSSQPVIYLHGHHGMLPGIEKVLEGKSAGEQLSVTLEPQQAYGQRRDLPPQRVSMKHVKKGTGKLKPGMVVHINTTDGPREAVVVKVGLKNIDVDANHPYAGKTLTFDIVIADVRDASKEELANGAANT